MSDHPAGFISMGSKVVTHKCYSAAIWLPFLQKVVYYIKAVCILLPPLS